MNTYLYAYINWRHKPRHDLADDTNNTNDKKSYNVLYRKNILRGKKQKVDGFSFIALFSLC